MPVDTRLDGSPEQVHATARWLLDQLAFEVGAGATAMTTAGVDATQGWQGAAGDAFRGRMSREAATAGELRAEITNKAARMTDLANQLAQAQQHMANARAIAVDGGLPVDGYLIGDPGGAPPVPHGTAPPEVLAAHTDAVALHQRQVDAYAQAEGEAGKATALVRFFGDTWKNIKDDVRNKWFFLIGDGANGLTGGLLREHLKALSAHAKGAAEEIKKLETAYLKSQGGSAHSRSLHELMSKEVLAAKQVEERAATGLGRRIAGRVPFIGAAIAVAGIGYDIENGKPAVKAVASGGGGIIGGILGGMAGGAMGGTLTGGPIGTVVGSVVGGVAGGLIASGVIDAAYDRLPEGVKDAFNDGQATVSKALGEAGGEAKKLWDEIF